MDDVLQRVLGAIAAAEKSLGLDWRFSYARAHSVDDGASEVELSRREVWEAIAAHVEGIPLEGTPGSGGATMSVGGGAVRIRLLEPPPDRSLWVVSSVADVRREPSHAAELLTQLIMGETADALKTEGDWFLARLPDGYHGWIRSWYVRDSSRAEIDSYGERARSHVVANVGYVLSSSHEKSLPVSDIVAGTRIAAGDLENGYRRVVLPGGREGFMRRSELADGAVSAADGRRVMNRALQFLGIPYLWGGTSPKGFDCSGLVKRVFLMEGMALPRDSDRQALVGAMIPRERIDAIVPGDLLFFGEGGKVSHVAISIGGATFVHAYGEVRINSLLPGDSRYDERLGRTFLFARSILSRGAPPSSGAGGNGAG
jgi:hypothetical protein